MANALDFYDLEETKETEEFVRIFDKFFDCLNVRCISASVQRRKPDLRPYRSPDDGRLKVYCYTYCSLMTIITPLSVTVDLFLSFSLSLSLSLSLPLGVTSTCMLCVIYNTPY